MSRKTAIVVYIDSELSEWLSKKAADGYKKGSFVRHLMRRQMEFENKGKVAS
ncbi:MAG: hypothetical protein M1158_02675 [Candidatus Marsarchaeota archaeon]|nr:hypothetical protein [Candidatus Marsarchaeota archaeon]